MKNNTHTLSEIVDHYNANNKQVAMNAYLDSDAHTTFLIASGLMSLCKNSAKNLAKGVVAPRLDICNNVSTFADIMLNSVEITYNGFDMPEYYDDSDEPKPLNLEITDEFYEECIKMNEQQLACILEKRYGCLRVDFVHTHIEDKQNQERYRKAVIEHFRKMASFAKSISSDSAKIWLDALRLLTLKEARKAYTRAEEAQEMLWVDLQFTKLPATQPTKTR